MGKVIQMFTDTLRSLVNGMGDPSKDKAAATYYTQNFVNEEQLVAAYKGSWIAGKIIDIPADDAFRKGRDWQADKEQITAIEEEEKRLRYWPKLIKTYKTARLFGGAAILIGTGERDLMRPLDPARIGTGGIKYLTVLSKRYLTASEKETDLTSDRYGEPKFYTLQSTDGIQTQIHPSRLVVFKGMEPLDDELTRPIKDGWGDSVLERVFQAVKNGDGASSSVATLLFEANVDVINIPDFMASLAAPDYAERFHNRLALAAAAKGINGMLVLDGNETYTRKQISFAGIPDVLMALLQVVSGAADIPITRFLGQSPAGLNSTGEGDMRNYHDRIQSIQNLEIRPATELLDACLLASAAVPPKSFYAWSPLEQMNEKQLAEIGKLFAETAASLTTSQILTPDELRAGVSNQLIENGIMPGLEDAMADTGEDWETAFEPTPEEIEMQRAQIEATRAKAGAPAAGQPPVADAAPRSLYVRRDVLNKAEIVAWAKAQGFTDIVEDLHVTIIYSKAAVDWMKVGSAWEEDIRIPPGGARLMEKFDGGAQVLLFNSNTIRYRNQEMIDAGAVSSYPDYQPHITISYVEHPDFESVEPYQGAIQFGPEIFQEVDDGWKEKVVGAS